jgi:hypothetical protein
MATVRAAAPEPTSDCDHAVVVIYAIPQKIGRWPTGEYAQWRRCRCGQVRMPEAVYQNRVPR